MSAFVSSAVVFAIPLLIAALAGLISERTGVLNVGLEGFMLGGAFVSAWIGGNDGSIAVGLLGTLLIGLAIGALYGLVVVHLRADQIAVGIAFNIFVLGATGLGFDLITQNSSLSALSTGSIGSVSVPGLASIPWIGPAFDQPWLAYVGYAMVPVVSIVLFRTGLGVRARACGEFSEGAQAAGINVARWRLAAMAISGMIAALAGSYLVLAETHMFAEDMTAGTGYIALAVIILSRWHPGGAVLAALLFGAAQSGILQLQANSLFGLHPPNELVQAIPYLVTLIAVGVAGRRVRGPAEDGRPLALR